MTFGDHGPAWLAAVREAVGGENNRLWKGDDAGYFALHSYLSRHFPKTGICEQCSASAETEYALIHGLRYSRDRGDYRELCHRCHVRYDQGGEANPQAKLTRVQVAEIRQRYEPSKGGGRPGMKRNPNSTRSLAEEFGVSHTVVRQIVAGAKWASELEAS